MYTDLRPKMICNGLFLALLIIGVAVPPSKAQVATNISSLIGTPAHARFLPIRFGELNLDTGDMHLEIPLFSLPERGLAPYELKLVYDSFFWYPTSVFGTDFLQGTQLYPTGTGWSIQVSGAMGDWGINPESSTVINCSTQRANDYGTITTVNRWSGVDSHGTLHEFNLYAVQNTCTLAQGGPDLATNPQSHGGTAYALDGSGYSLTVASDGYTTNVIAPDGTQGAQIQSGSGSSYLTLVGDEPPNGNVSSYYGNPLVNGAYSSFDELGEPVNNYQTPCVASDGSSLSITQERQVTSRQPYAAQPSVTCTITLPAWDSISQSATNIQYVSVYEYIPVCTKFYSDTISNDEYCGGMWVLQAMTLPGDQGSYQFGYDTGTSGTHLGELTSITLPTGGTTGYAYGTPPNSPISNDTPFVISVADLGGTTTISYGGSTVYNPYPETITFPPHPATPGGSTMMQDKRTISAGSNSTSVNAVPPYTINDYSGSTLIRSTVENRDSANRVTSVASTWTATQESHTVDFKYADDSSLPGYQSYGGVPINMIAQESEYDSGALVRTLTTQYIKDTSANKYVSTYNMINYPVSQTMTDGSGTGIPIAQTLYTYDEYSASYCQTSYPNGLSGIPMLTSVTGASGHDDSRGTSYTARGNITTVQQMISPGVYVSSHKCYDTLGNVLQTIDGNGKATRYSYQDSHLDNACISSGTNTYAFPTLVTNQLGQQTAMAYYTCNRAVGQLQSPNDMSSKSGGTRTTFDTLGRVRCVTAADGGMACTSYPNPTEIDVTNALNDSFDIFLDGYGQSVSRVDAGSGAEVDTSYDQLGRTNCVSNPYYENAGISGSTCYAYDVLSRITGVLYADGKLLSDSYSGDTVIATDPLGNQVKRRTDALGRITQVWEPNGSGQTPSMETDYCYDALNNLEYVMQSGGSAGTFTCANLSPPSGARTRSFSYDGLSRLVQAFNPEVGWICYGTTGGALPNGSNCTETYDGNGNLQSKIDARGVSTNYHYDALNRLYSKTYTNAPAGTLSSCYQYDTGTNGIGQLGAEWTQPGSCASAPPPNLQSLRAFGAYDAMGRVLTEQQCTMGYCTSPSLPSQPPANCATISAATGLQFCYDLDGNLLAYSNGITTSSAGQYTQHALLFSQMFDVAGRLTTSTSSWSDSTHPQQLFSSPSYTPFNALSNWLLGGQLSTSRTYDSRLRITCQWSSTLNQTPSSLCQ